MKLPLSWLKEYVDITVPLPELAHRLTMAGLEVSAIERRGGDWERIAMLKWGIDDIRLFYGNDLRFLRQF